MASSRIEGKWQVINYWATWCGPCITEVPELNDLARILERLIVLGVDYDAPSEAEERWRRLKNGNSISGSRLTQRPVLARAADHITHYDPG